MIRNISTGTIHKWDTLNGVGAGGGGGGTYTADETTLHLASTVFSIKSTYTGQTSIINVGNLQNGALVAGFTPVTDPLIASSATWNAKLSPALTSAFIFAGNGSNIATGVSPSGDLTMTNAGVFTLASTITGGSCTNCNLTYDAKGRITVAANGAGGGSGTPFPDNSTLIKNNADNTKLLILGAANITTATTRTLQSPDANGTIDLTNNIATLTNKTIAAGSNTITGLTNTNLSGTAGISNANLANSTISGVALGSTLFTHVPGFGLSGSNYTGAASQTWLVDTSTTHGPASKDYVNARMNGFVDPMTTAYDMIYRNGSNVLARLPKGAEGSVLSVSAGVVGYNSYNTYAVNGLHFNLAGDSLKLGGSLIENTTISGHNTYTTTFDSTQIYLTGNTYNTIINADSTNNKVLVRNTSTGKVSAMYWPATGGGGGGGVALDATQTYTSGSTLTVTNGNNYVYVNPATVQAALTITLPTTWHNSNDLYIVFGGTVTSGNPVITSFSVTAGSGQTKVEAVTPSGTFNAGEVIRYHINGTLDYRIN